MYHLLRADEFDASRAKELGFIQEVVPAGSQLDRAKEIASEIGQWPDSDSRDQESFPSLFRIDEAAAFAEIENMKELL